MTTHSSPVALDERYLSPDTGSRFARTPLREGDPRRIGRYRLTARLGTGGMAVVYLGVAEDGRLVAVKIIRPELADDPEFQARFGREVAVLARVRGERVVRVIEAGADACGPFLVTEYAAGPSLAASVDGDRAVRLRAAVRAGHRAGRGAGRHPRGRCRAPGPQAVQRDPDRRRPQGHRLRHRPGAGLGVADPHRHDDRLGRLHGPGAGHRPGRPGRRHLRLGGDRGLRGQRPAAVRHRGDRRRDVPHPARPARPAARSRRRCGRYGGRAGQGARGPARRARDPRPAGRPAARARRPLGDADGTGLGAGHAGPADHRGSATSGPRATPRTRPAPDPPPGEDSDPGRAARRDHRAGPGRADGTPPPAGRTRRAAGRLAIPGRSPRARSEYIRGSRTAACSRRSAGRPPTAAPS